METLNEDDLDYLTKTENKLMRMRKRESANTKSLLVDESLEEAIKAIDDARKWLSGRLGVESKHMTHNQRWGG